MLTLVLTGSLFLIFWAYFGYPLSLEVVSLFRSQAVAKGDYLPSMTLIITVHNEEKRIREKLENTLGIDYPRNRLQVLVASDGSTDATNSIVSEYADRGIDLFEVRRRGGKENAQREAVAVATGEIIAFSDVATIILPDGLRAIAANFADPTVGCVSSVDRIVGHDGKSCGEGFYVRYEMWLRGLESRVNSLVGLSGSFFAARRKVCADFSAEMQSDFRTVLNSMKLGLRGISDPAVIGYYPDIADSNKEFDRKVRTVLRGLTVYFRNLEFLNPFRYGLFAYQFFCHKLLRWLVPLFLLLALISNLLLINFSDLFLLLFLGQAAFYAAAFYAWRQRETPTQILLKIPLYFMTVNLSILVAWWRYLSGNRMVMWAPSQR
ncbi:MAG: glycosyltransferase family 2 protein [Desulfuromonadales bacterium]|nr:glycosyltransferase family 2 protein [Desulfuromonadales bacterium]